MAPAWWAALVALVAALYVGIDLEDLSPTEDGDFDFSLLPAEVQVNYELPATLCAAKTTTCTDSRIAESSPTLLVRAGLVEARAL
jgi:hypothetical protein